MDDAYVFFDEIPLVQTPRTNEPTLKVSAVTSSPSPHSSSPVTSSSAGRIQGRVIVYSAPCTYVY